MPAGSGVASPSGRPFPEGRARPAAKLLPRGDVLILGGDLAYPNPSMETYELRFFAPFEAALPPPPVSTSLLSEECCKTWALPHAWTLCCMLPYLALMLKCTISCKIDPYTPFSYLV